MSYFLTPSKFLRHLAVSYRRQRKSILARGDDEKETLRKRLQKLEEKYAELSGELDETTAYRISKRISSLKSML